MGIIVQKYGGTSLATPAELKSVARRVVETRKRGDSVVVVVSAMGDTTDELLALAAAVSKTPHRRELDMLLTAGERISIALLSMAIHDLGYPAKSFTGSQSGIITTNNHTNARIIRVTPVRIRKALDAGQVVIVAGFQGVSERLEITSLGRGGTDTTAIALAAALNADFAEICSDVDGIYSADPRKVPDARRLDSLTYDEMQVLAEAGARVLNAEAVEWARREGIEIRCVATGDASNIGTSIRAAGGLDHPRVTTIAAHPGIHYIEGTEPGAPPPPDLESTLAAHGATDAEVWLLPSSWGAVVPRANLHGARAFAEALAALGGVSLREDLGLVTVVGRALSAPPGLARQAATTLTARGISLHGRLLDPGRAAFLVNAARIDEAVSALHAALVV